VPPFLIDVIGVITSAWERVNPKVLTGVLGVNTSEPVEVAVYVVALGDVLTRVMKLLLPVWLAVKKPFTVGSALIAVARCPAKFEALVSGVPPPTVV
jgi:hypothetical protein